ncbi:hypothetical protein [Rhizobium herbae]
MKNPFIPSRSPICRLADTVLVFSITIAGLVAVLAAIANQFSGAL